MPASLAPSHRLAANWIRAEAPQGAAPILRAAFDLPCAPRRAVAHVVAPGWHEMFVNGRRIGAAALSPVPMVFDRHVPQLEIDVSGLLREGRNAVAFVLGNGWFNMFRSDCWGFDHATWIDAPKLLCEIVADGRTALRSDESWRWATGPLVESSLRGGETYDARAELPGFAEPTLDDAAWRHAVRCVPSGGSPRRATAAPSRPGAPIEAVSRKALCGAEKGAVVWDFGGSLAGWGELEVVGEAGAKVEIEYAEKLLPDGDLDRRNIDSLVNGNRFQRDEYILAGRPEGETWHARFTYHGFRWARTRVVEGAATVRALRAIPVRPGFDEIGAARCSDPIFGRLLELTRTSYLDNFAGGFPTDCPHREKNGWTGDAQLALETGLWTFAGDENYRNQLRMMADAQRPEGVVPCILPTASFGYLWGTGPAWDAYLFEGPWQLFLFRGEDATARELYPAMRRHLGYARSMVARGLVDYGLGDWCRPHGAPDTPVRLTSSAYVLHMARVFAFFARRFGRAADARRAEALAAALRGNLRAEFRRPDGSWAEGSPTALGCALHFGLCDPGPETDATVRRLVETVRARRHRCDFGILGAKWVPRALAAHGHVDDAWRLFTQTEPPGYGHWVKTGATALHEDFHDEGSLDHIMFGDLAAWSFEYLGGLRLAPERAGFSSLELRPLFPAGLGSYAARHRSPKGDIEVSWRREREGIRYTATVPRGVRATLALPGRRPVRFTGGTRSVSLPRK